MADVAAPPRGPARVLDEPQTRRIHEASLDLLARVGCVIPVAEARVLLGDSGAVVEGERVRIPPSLVERSLRSWRPTTIFNRRGEAVLPLGERRVTFGALVDTIYVSDPVERRVRSFMCQDQAWLAAILDALPGVDWVQCVGQAHDVPNHLQTQIAVARTVRSTVKPILAYPYDRRGLLDILDLAHRLAGGQEGFRDRPSIFFASVPSAPLVGTVYNLEILLTCAERNVPVLYYPCPAIGGNSPCSLEGTLILANADWLSALVIHQLRSPGAPFCSAGFTIQLMDMRTTLWAYCSPESLLAYAAVTDLAHGYGMPAWGLEMISDVPQLNAQAGAEMAANAHWALWCGVELVHNTGMIGAGKVCSAEAFVLADEIIRGARLAHRPLGMLDSALGQAARQIEDAGPGAEYVSREHTLEHFRDFWYPTVFDRSNFDPLRIAPESELADRLNARVRELIESHRPEPLSDGVERELQALEAEWRRRRT